MKNNLVLVGGRLAGPALAFPFLADLFTWHAGRATMFGTGLPDILSGLLPFADAPKIAPSLADVSGTFDLLTPEIVLALAFLIASCLAVLVASEWTVSILASFVRHTLTSRSTN